MPSFLMSNRSGGDLLLSGNPWSGQLRPQGGIQVRWDKNASGNAFVGLSGGMTVQSGGFFLSGSSGMLDGMQLAPGDTYWIPHIATGASGLFSVYITCEVAASGQGRVYYEVF